MLNKHALEVIIHLLHSNILTLPTVSNVKKANIPGEKDTIHLHNISGSVLQVPCELLSRLGKRKMLQPQRLFTHRITLNGYSFLKDSHCIRVRGTLDALFG